MTECRNPECVERDQIAANQMAAMVREINRLQERVKEQDAELAQCRGPRQDWDDAHDLLDAAGVAPGDHLRRRIEAALAVWEPIGRLSAQSCHDLRFLFNTPEEAIEAIRAHRATYVKQEVKP